MLQICEKKLSLSLWGKSSKIFWQMNIRILKKTPEEILAESCEKVLVKILKDVSSNRSIFSDKKSDTAPLYFGITLLAIVNHFTFTLQSLRVTFGAQTQLVPWGFGTWTAEAPKRTGVVWGLAEDPIRWLRKLVLECRQCDKKYAYTNT